MGQAELFPAPVPAASPSVPGGTGSSCVEQWAELLQLGPMPALASRSTQPETEAWKSLDKAPLAQGDACAPHPWVRVKRSVLETCYNFPSQSKAARRGVAVPLCVCVRKDRTLTAACLGCVEKLTEDERQVTTAARMERMMWRREEKGKNHPKAHQGREKAEPRERAPLTKAHETQFCRCSCV